MRDAAHESGEGVERMSVEGEARTVQHRRSPKGEQRRREILAAAAYMFAQGGYDSASLADIARQAGITQAGLLHHFPSKTTLLLTVLDQREVLEEDAPLAHGVGFLIRFITTLRRHESDPSEMAFFAMISTESATPTHPAHEYFLSRYQGIARDFTVELERVFDAARLPAHISVLDLTRSLVAIADGMRIQWLFEPNVVLRSELIVRFLELLEPYMFDGARDEFRASILDWRRSEPRRR